MNFKTADLAKIEIFAPGTAGERAIRVEKKDGEVVIIDEKDAATILIIPKIVDEEGNTWDFIN